MGACGSTSGGCGVGATVACREMQFVFSFFMCIPQPIIVFAYFPNAYLARKKYFSLKSQNFDTTPPTSKRESLYMARTLCRSGVTVVAPDYTIAPAGAMFVGVLLPRVVVVVALLLL